MFSIIIIGLLVFVFILSIILIVVRSIIDRIEQDIEDAHLDAWMKEHLKNKTP